jgi:hypothetical protein
MTSRGLKHDKEAVRKLRAEEKRLRRQERRNGDAPEAAPAAPDPQPAPGLSVSQELEERRRLVAWRWAQRR